MESTEFITAIKQLAAERGIEVEEILDAVKQAMKIGFRTEDEDDPEAGSNIEVEIDSISGTIDVYADKKVVEMVTNPSTQISLDDAKKIEPKLKVGDHVLVEITATGDFGRVAAQAAKQVILQKLRESEKEAILRELKDKVGTVDSAVIQRMDREGNVFLEIQRATVKMPPTDQIKGEYYKSGARIKVYLKKILEDARGKILIVSRSDPEFLRALFEIEVPEIASGTVEIMGVAREAGSRSKIAVRSNADGVDAIGSCVGQRGARIGAVTNELKTQSTEEKIDIIEWEPEISEFISNAVKPAEALSVKIINEDKQQALILVDDEALSLAIGRDGQNVRLAAKLTGWSLDIQGVNMYAKNGKLSKFEIDSGVKPVIQPTQDKSPETDTDNESQSEQESEQTKEGEIQTLGLPTRVENAVIAAGITTVAELKSKIESEEKIEGVGPKSVEEIKSKI